MKRLICFSMLIVSVAAAQERLPMIPANQQTDAQKKAIAGMQGGSFAVGGPFIALLREPKLAEQAVAMATYFRNEGVLGPKVTEFLIMLAARDWTQQFEWTAHYARALKAGLKQETVDAIAAGRRPLGMPEDEEIAYDFWTELEHNKSVSDATYDRALKRFGEAGVVSIAALNGYYAMLAMVLNVARTPILPENAQVPQLTALPKSVHRTIEVVNPQPSPDERFEEVQSILNQLSNSQRHLLTAQVLMNDRLDRTERALQKAAETIQAVAEQQKHTDSNLAALTDIVRRWYESHGNGGGQHPS